MLSSASAHAASCEYCGDAKFISYDVPIGHPEFGRIHPCPKCNRDEIARRSGLDERERQIWLGDIIITAGRPGAAAMKTAAEKFVAKPRGFLSFYGGYGTGKTVALQAIVNECNERGIEAVYLTAHELMDYLYAAFNKSVMETDRDRINRLATVLVLAIDELDKVRDTQYAADMQFHLFDTRYRRAHELGTVLAWNGVLDTLPWPAVVSRISEFRHIQVSDSDMRPIIGGAK